MVMSTYVALDDVERLSRCSRGHGESAACGEVDGRIAPEVDCTKVSGKR